MSIRFVRCRAYGRRIGRPDFPRTIVEFQERFSDEAALLGPGAIHEPTTYGEITHAAA